jgi:flagellar biosynthesis/type III secretory pathway protein FliH
MTEGFRSLASSLREARVAAGASVPVVAVAPQTSPPGAPDAVALPAEYAALCDEIAAARVGVMEAYERSQSRLLETLARDVLARELALAPVDVAALVRRALDELADDEPVAVIVAPADAPAVNPALPVRIDPSLTPGDLVVIVRDGVIDARLALRARRAVREIA